MALQALYQTDVCEMAARGVLDGLAVLLGEEDLALRPSADEMEFARDIVNGVWQRRAEIDQRIEAASLNWRLSRMPVVDRNILRLSTWELLGCDETPTSVVINEAVELAKKYGGDESRSFVNGILDRIAFESGRGGRGSRRGG
jgi:N utilization substance protein B